MFTWFQKKKEKNKDWRNSPAHLLLLSKFLNGDSPDRYRDDKYWEAALKEKTLNVIEQFIQEGVLEAADLQELVAYKFKVSDLKLLLKDKGLKVSGRKEELIQSLIENDAQSMRDATKGLIFYRCTKDGLQIAEHYLEGERAKRDTAERAVLDLLGRKDFSGAVRIVAQYDASEAFPRGFDVRSGTESLKLIFERTPGILKGMKEEKLSEVRRAAAMMNLWGTNSGRRWLPDDFETGIHLDGDAASRMLVFHAGHIRHMQDYRSSSVVKKVEVIGAEDVNMCSECRKISGKKFKLEDVPELPYAKCTCELGCRCCTGAVV